MRCRDYFALPILLKEMFFKTFAVISSRIYNSALFKARCTLRINERGQHDNNRDFCMIFDMPAGLLLCMYASYCNQL